MWFEGYTNRDRYTLSDFRDTSAMSETAINKLARRQHPGFEVLHFKSKSMGFTVLAVAIKTALFSCQIFNSCGFVVFY